MSGLEALGLACNIFQVISFGRETAQIAKKIYKDGSFDSSVEKKATVLNDVVTGFHSRNPLPAQTPEHQRLLDISRECQDVAQSLKVEVARISTTAQPESWVASAKTTAKALYRSRKLRELEDKLADLEKTMQTGLLERTFHTIQDVTYNLDSRDHNLRYFIDQYNKGCRDTSDLVLKEAAETKETVRMEATQTRIHVTDEIRGHQTAVEGRIEDLRQNADYKDKCDRFLRSFKFEGMNERRNQITSSYPNTFKWIFQEDDTADQVADESSSYQSSESGSFGSSWEDEDDEDYDTPPTARWDSLSDWLGSKEGVDPYWISGKPGSGKTTLVKYIIGHSQTLEYLRNWAEETIIVSHFIWRLGASRMQSNTKGLLCSLLHQLLKESQDVLENLLSHHEGAAFKDSHTDWSVCELQSVLKKTIQSFNRPVLFVVDGLDEIEGNNSTEELFDIIYNLHSRVDFKVCVSSRPDKEFQNHLHQAPQLRLQDLTSGDISCYIHENLSISSEMISESEIRRIISDLVDKAEGVFLWAVLVVNNLKRGVRRGDSYDVLSDRIEALPSDLADLYYDMWERMNQNDSVYEKSAADYFQLMIAFDHFEVGWFYGIKPMVLLFASDKSRCQKIQRDIEEPSSTADVLSRLCRNITTEVKTRCTGLVEFCDTRNYEKEWKCSHEAYAGLSCYIDGTHSFQFIHRTARDFLNDTQEGRNILARSSMSESEARIRICNALLACSQLFYAGWRVKVDNFMHIFKIFEWDGLFALPSTTEDVYRCVDVCLDLCQRGKILEHNIRDGREHPSRPCGRVRFLELAAHYNLTSWLSRLLCGDTLSPTLVSCILLNMEPNAQSRNQELDIALCRTLLQKGADTNFAQFTDVYTMRLATNRGGYLHLLTPFSRTLKEAIYSASSPRKLLLVLDMFLDYGADLKTSMCTIFEVFENGHWDILKAPRYWFDLPDNGFLVQFTAAHAISVLLDRLDAQGTSADLETRHLIVALRSRIGKLEKDSMQLLLMNQPDQCPRKCKVAVVPESKRGRVAHDAYTCHVAEWAFDGFGVPVMIGPAADRLAEWYRTHASSMWDAEGGEPQDLTQVLLERGLIRHNDWEATYQAYTQDLQNSTREEEDNGRETDSDLD